LSVEKAKWERRERRMEKGRWPLFDLTVACE